MKKTSFDIIVVCCPILKVTIRQSDLTQLSAQSPQLPAILIGHIETLI